MTDTLATPFAAPPAARWPARLSTFALWGALVGVVFFSVYPTMNWLTGQRPQQYALYFAGELNIPFVPQFIWFYLSMYLLFAAPPFFLEPGQLRRLARELIAGTLAAGVVFLLLPARLGFTRSLPGDPLLDALYAGIFALDQPFNLVPSLHVVYSAAIALAIAAPGGRGRQLLFGLWLALICASTLLVHQHHLLDVGSGLLLAGFLHFFARKE